MNVGVLGTGVVGRTIGSALVAAGHAVRMGSRSGDNPTAKEWARTAGRSASQGTFAEAAAFGEMLFNCTAGTVSLAVLEQARAENLRGKILIDLANPLDFSQGMPPTLTVCNTDSLGEQIQRAFPDVKVVKTLNTLNCQVMVDPSRVPGEHNLFMSGDDGEAKARVAGLLQQAFSWPAGSIIDLGDIRSARGTEMLLPIWLRLWGTLGTGDFNFSIAGAPARQPSSADLPAPLAAVPPAR